MCGYKSNSRWSVGHTCIKASNKKKDTIRNSGVHVDKLFNDYIYKCTCMCNLDRRVYYDDVKSNFINT